MREVRIEVYLPDDQAWAFAQFLKRVGYSDYASLAEDASQAYAMQDAGEKVRQALAQVGHAPR